jgi:hypothetical protein
VPTKRVLSRDREGAVNATDGLRTGLFMGKLSQIPLDQDTISRLNSRPVALVTGVSRGIGRSIAIELAWSQAVAGRYKSQYDMAQKASL